MKKYHGTAITPKQVFLDHMGERNTLIPFLDNRDYGRASQICSDVIIDNSAYTFFLKKEKADWDKFYEWLEPLKREFFFIPDVIDGTEKENDLMKIVCDKDGYPKVRTHMLRCLFPKIFTRYPFWSGDSTNFARNHHLYKDKERFLNSFEQYDSPERYEFKYREFIQVDMFGGGEKFVV